MDAVDLEESSVSGSVWVVWIVCVWVQSAFAICYGESRVRFFVECILDERNDVGLTLSIYLRILFELSLSSI